jgi:hypothetical protein
MTITYFPTNSNALPPCGTLPCTYPGAPINGGVGVGLTLPDLVFASVLDVMEGTPLQAPINMSWLFDIFESALDELPPRIQLHQYGPLSRSWKRALSETIANSISLGIALFEEGFDWAVPVPLIKDVNSLPDWWPWVHNIFSAQPMPTVPPAMQYPLMPDFLLGTTVGGVTSFSSMEVKGRDSPLDTANFSAYGDFKRQSENIQLRDAAGLVVPLQRKILSVVAVRPTLVNPANRELKCRWFNHADLPDETPPGFLTQITVTQCSVLIRRLFGIWPRLPLIWHTKDGPSVGRVAPHLLAVFDLEPVDGGYIRPSTVQDRSPWRPFISHDTLDLLEALWHTLPRADGGREHLLAMDRLITQFLAERKPINREHGPMLRIGIGLKFVREG